jgi:hypothetical protein
MGNQLITRFSGKKKLDLKQVKCKQLLKRCFCFVFFF